ncbi:MAG: UbiA family prenyltransferase [Methanomassiliicoccales archaeon]|nr:UbiA family prenyltransferase [Methanomassiliicoccales archaeon]
MIPLLKLFRTGNAVMGVIGLIIGVLIATGTDILEHWQPIVWAAVAVFAFIAGGNSLNDYTDREVDKLAHPERPLPSGRVTPRQVLYISAACFVVSFLSSLALNLPSTIIVVLAIVLMMSYEVKLKKDALTGNLEIALLTGMLFLLGGAVVGMMERTYVIALLAFLAILGREIVKDIEDMEGDFDRLTLPKKIGARNAGIVASVSFLVAVALSPLPYLDGTFGIWYLGAVLFADAIFIYCSIVHFENPTKGQKLAKYGMFLALLAFLVGGLL